MNYPPQTPLFRFLVPCINSDRRIVQFQYKSIAHHAAKIFERDEIVNILSADCCTLVKYPEGTGTEPQSSPTTELVREEIYSNSTTAKYQLYSQP